MRYKSDDPKFKDFKVEVDGVFYQDIVEADDEEGWARIEIKKSAPWIGYYFERKTLYGKVFIVRIGK